MLTGLSWLYSKIIESRNSLYSRGLLEAERLPGPTISVGNITVGGTGKTPLVAYISEELARRGEKVCVISRGYRRKDESKRVPVSDWGAILSDPLNAGDEPYELARNLIGKAIVIADRDRVAAATWAHKEYGVTAFVLDDAFQHLRAARDLDIVVIDSTNAFGNLRTIPGGILRERLTNLARADVAVLSRTNLCVDIEGLVKQIEGIAPNLPVFKSRNITKGFRSLADFYGNNDKLREISPGPALAFCGLGNPDSFFDQLSLSGVDLIDSRVFPDHHRYTADDIRTIEEEARIKGASVLITTAKDAVKLTQADHTLPCFVCETALEFKNKKGFTEILGKALSGTNQLTSI